MEIVKGRSILKENVLPIVVSRFEVEQAKVIATYSSAIEMGIRDLFIVVSMALGSLDHPYVVMP